MKHDVCFNEVTDEVKVRRSVDRSRTMFSEAYVGIW